MKSTDPGIVYLLHFDKPYQAKTGARKKTAAHYIGWTNNLRDRVNEHARGGGARLMEIIALDGIGFTVARTWTGDRKTERHLKNRHNHRVLCPCCDAQRSARNAATLGAVKVDAAAYRAAAVEAQKTTGEILPGVVIVPERESFGVTFGKDSHDSPGGKEADEAA